MIENIKKELQIFTWIKQILEKKIFFLYKSKKKKVFLIRIFFDMKFSLVRNFFLTEKREIFSLPKKISKQTKNSFNFCLKRKKKRSSIFAWIKQFRQEKKFFLEKQIFFWWEIQKNFYLLKKLYSSRILLVVEKKWS